jgi:hypothetical protein
LIACAMPVDTLFQNAQGMANLGLTLLANGE